MLLGENDETTGAKYPNEIDSEVTGTNKMSEIPNFMRKILPDDEITGLHALNSKQGEFFHVVNKWAKDYAKYGENNMKSVYIFFSGRCGTGKSCLVKAIYNAI